MDCGMPCLPVPHHLLKFAQVHVHWIDAAIHPSHPLSSPSPPALNLSQHQGLFQRVSSSHQVTKELELKLQHQSFQWTPRTDLLEDGPVGCPCSPRDSQESSPTPQLKSINSSALWLLYGPTLTPTHDPWENHSSHLQLTLFCCCFKLLSESTSLCPHGRHRPWNSRPDTGVGNRSLLQGIFPTQGLNPGLSHCKQIL